MTDRRKSRIGAVLGAALVLSTVALSAASGAMAQSDDSDEVEAKTSITMLHSIPGVVVDLYVDDELVIAGFDAGDTQDLTPLAGMTLTNIEAREPGGTAVLIGPISTFEVPEAGNATVAVHLDEQGAPTITPYLNSTPPSDQGRGRLVIRHVAAAPPVDLQIDDADVLSNIGNGQEDSLVVPAGDVVGAWITGDGEQLAQLPALEVEANTDVIIYIGGSLVADDLEFYLQIIGGEPDASISGPATVADSDTAAATTDDGDAAADSDDSDDGDDGDDDGTPQPTGVNTGEPIDVRSRNGALLFGGAALLLIAALGFAFQQRRLRDEDMGGTR